MSGPNAFSVLFSILRARRLPPPRPSGSEGFDHSDLNPILEAVAAGGIDALAPLESDIRSYIGALERTDPNSLSRDEALAFWINIYNAVVLDLVRRTRVGRHESVLEIRGGFQSPVIRIGAEDLTLIGIEHGKIRRFGDPRIHAALVCGSLSCPTLRFEAFEGDSLDRQLEEQMTYFLSAGGLVTDKEAATVDLSRVLLWYGADFTRPHRMPTLLPARRRNVARRIGRWLNREDATWLFDARPKIAFQKYDWALGCAVSGRPGPA